MARPMARVPTARRPAAGGPRPQGPRALRGLPARLAQMQVMPMEESRHGLCLLL